MQRPVRRRFVHTVRLCLGEFTGASARVKLLLSLMFLFFLLCLTSIALAPIIK